MEGRAPPSPVLARFCRFDLESTNVDPKLLRDGRSGSPSRTFAGAGPSQSRTQRRNLDFVGGLEHCDSRCPCRDRRTPLRTTRERGGDEPNRSVRSMELLSGEKHQGFRSEEHTSELQSQSNLVCRLLLEKKKIRS